MSSKCDRASPPRPLQRSFSHQPHPALSVCHRLFKADHGLFLNLTLFSLLKIRCSIRVWEKCTSSLNKLAWAMVGIGFWRPTNRQCRVGLVGKWPLKWRRGTGSVTFRWHVIVESKIWAKFFFGGAFPSLKVEQRSWFSAQTFLNYRSFTSRKRIAERLAETLKFWRNSRRPPGRAASLVELYVGEQTAANETSRNGQERLQKRPNR